MTAPEQMRACPTPWCSHDCTPYTWQGPSDHYTVICEECQVEGPYCATEAQAITAWNTRPAPAELVEAQWQPTSEAINSLPEPLRRFIHDLAAKCDPAGDVKVIWSQREQIAGLVARVKELENGRA